MGKQNRKSGGKGWKPKSEGSKSSIRIEDKLMGSRTSNLEWERQPMQQISGKQKSRCAGLLALRPLRGLTRPVKPCSTSLLPSPSSMRHPSSPPERRGSRRATAPQRLSCSTTMPSITKRRSTRGTGSSTNEMSRITTRRPSNGPQTVQRCITS